MASNNVDSNMLHLSFSHSPRASQRARSTQSGLISKRAGTPMQFEDPKLSGVIVDSQDETQPLNGKASDQARQARQSQDSIKFKEEGRRKKDKSKGTTKAQSTNDMLQRIKKLKNRIQVVQLEKKYEDEDGHLPGDEQEPGTPISKSPSANSLVKRRVIKSP